MRARKYVGKKRRVSTGTGIGHADTGWRGSLGMKVRKRESKNAAMRQCAAGPSGGWTSPSRERNRHDQRSEKKKIGRGQKRSAKQKKGQTVGERRRWSTVEREVAARAKGAREREQQASWPERAK